MVEPIQIHGVPINVPASPAQGSAEPGIAHQFSHESDPQDGFQADLVSIDAAWVRSVLALIQEVDAHCEEHFESRWTFRAHLDAISAASGPVLPSRNSIRP